jgi:isocitrate/isopropylmalate dehydrogenase
MVTSFNIVVFGGDHCGPEVAAEAVKVLKAIEKHSPDVKFNFQEHLFGGVCHCLLYIRQDISLIGVTYSAPSTPTAHH